MSDVLVTAAAAVLGFVAFAVLSGRWTPAARARRAADAAATGVPLPMRVPVPWMYVLTFLAGVGLHALRPIPLAPPSARLYFWLGAVVLTAGVALSAWGLRLFHQAHTTTVPFAQPAALVLSGPYRFSRNPMYVGLALVYAGAAGLYGLVWPLALLPLLLLYVNGVVIPVEERRLRQVFGSAYEQYCARVRRWV